MAFNLSVLGSAAAAFFALSVHYNAVSGAPSTDLKPGMTCTVPDGWWSLDPAKPVQTEPVKVLLLKALSSGEPGAWIQPLRGTLQNHQFQVAIERLTDCH